MNSSSEPMPRFSLRAILGVVAYVALLLGMWKSIGAGWTILLSGLILLFVVLCVTSVWKRPGIHCPACQKPVPPLIFKYSYPCRHCHAKLQSDNWASFYYFLLTSVCIGLPLRSLKFGVTWTSFIITIIVTYILLTVFAIPYTRALPADEPQATLREWVYSKFYLTPKEFWICWGLLTGISAVGFSFLHRVAFGVWVAVVLLVIGCVIRFVLLDLCVLGPVRVPERGEIRSRMKIFAAAGLAGFAIWHFGLSGINWVAFSMEPDTSLWEEVLPFAWICFGLLGLSVFAFVQALRRRKSAFWLLAVLLLSSALGFWYDAHYERYQWFYEGTQEYFDNGGREYVYLNWPNYDPH